MTKIQDKLEVLTTDLQEAVADYNRGAEMLNEARERILGIQKAIDTLKELLGEEAKVLAD